MEKAYKYNAFISYRHISPDKEIADKLQKKLENYKPPKQLINGKRAVNWHIFRDETELPTSSNLSEDIKTALEDSEYLIVVCSESTKKSRWCMEEIEYFKQIHNGNNANIVTLVAEGNPEDVFPDALCNELIPVTDDEGNVTYQNHVIEPLAANVASKNLKTSLKKLNTEFLRIAAPILGCGYDELYNRNQKKRIKRLLTASAIVMACLFAFGLYTSAMLYEINSQKTALQVANNNLKLKTEELDKSNQELQESNTNLEAKTKEAEDNLAEAENQKSIAEQNLSEANRQKQIAEKNLSEANRQKQIAEDNLLEVNRQKQIAEDNLAEANRQKEIATNNEKEANNQRILAETNAKEAETQRGIAEENMLVAQMNEAKANEKTRLAQIENSKNLVNLSNQLWDAGDGIGAIKTTLDALPSNEEDKPVVSAATNTLAKQIGAFNDENFSAVVKLMCADNIIQAGYAGDGKTFVTQDSTGIYFWNTQSGELKKKYTNEELNNNNYSGIDVYFDNKGIYEKFGGLYKSTKQGLYMRNEFNYVEGYRKNKFDEVSIASADILVIGSKVVYKMDGNTGDILWEINKNTWSGCNVTDTNIIWTERISNQQNETIGYKISIFDRFSGEKEQELELIGDVDEISSVSGVWLVSLNNKIYYYCDSYNGHKLISYEIINNKLVNKRTLYDSKQDPMSEIYDNVFTTTVEIVNNHLYLIQAFSDGLEYEFITEVLMFDEKGNRQWTCTYNNDFSYKNHTRIIEPDSEICNNSFGITAIVAGDTVELIRTETGEHIFSYKFDSIIKESYCNKSGGTLFVITNGGYEVGLGLGDIKDENIKQWNRVVYQIHNFMGEHQRYAYFNQNYAVSNANSNEVYLYCDVRNDNYQKWNSYEKAISKAMLNQSQTHMVVDCYDNIYVYDIASKNEYKLFEKSNEENSYISDAMFISDNLFAVVESGKTVRVFDIRSGGMLFEKKCEYLFNVDHLTNKIGTVENRLVLSEDSKQICVFDVNTNQWKYWEPKRKSNFDYRDWDTGWVSDIHLSDKSAKLLAKVSYYPDSVLEIYDVNTEASVPLEIDINIDDSKLLKINAVEWINDYVVIAFDDGFIRSFDTETGKIKSEFLWANPFVISIVDLGSDEFVGLLCKDSVLYKTDLNDGVIYGSINVNNDYIKSSSYDKTTSQILNAKNMLILSGWNKNFSSNHAYIIDLKEFDICFEVDDYSGFVESTNQIVVNHGNDIGTYPLYETNALIEKALKYIAE